MGTWVKNNLSDVADLVMGQSPDSRFYNSEGRGMPFLQGCAQFGKTVPDTNIFCSAPTKIAAAGSILFSVRAPVGDINRADRDYCIGRGIAAIVPTAANARYIENYLRFLKPEFDRITQGSTFGAINSRELSSVKLHMPTEEVEQSRIADVLATVDRVIERTESLIAKYQRIKTGLMQDLLSRGIDEHGRLRDPATHKFKPSPLGLIPREWDLVVVEKAGDVKLGRQRSPAHHSGTHMMPYLRVANVFDGWIDYSDVLQMNFTPAEQKTFGLVPGDILLNEGQSLELVGRSSIFNGPEKTYCFQNTLVRFRCNATTIPTFCQFVFKHWLDTERFQVVAKQTTSVAHLGADRFAKMPFGRPDREEQKRIAAVLQSQSDCLDAEARKLVKLQRLKNGLMQDLLTGNVPVEPLLEKEIHP